MTKKNYEHMVIYTPSTGYKRKDGFIKFVSSKITKLLEKKEIKKIKLTVDTTTGQIVEFDYTMPERK
jgi:hypothetical protein